MRRKPGKAILWPQYFDADRAWHMGRKLPLTNSVPLPTVQELYDAASSLGYESEINPTAKYPKSWYDPPGNLLIDVLGQKKKFVMIKIAAKIADKRSKLAVQKTAEESKKKKKKH
jgi:signal recognition particle subunit SEC65